MKITLFTSNKSCHNYFINLLSEICDELFVVQECGTIFPGIISDHYDSSDTMRAYFDKVNEAQLKIFNKTYINKSAKIKLFPMLMGDLNKCDENLLSDFLQSDIYLVYGSSYIKKPLVDFLVKKKAINIHVGVSPYYRGTDCNFWALYDGNPHLVGSTIHFLSKGLDSGPILYHAMSNNKTNAFDYTMSSVKAAFHSIVERIKDKSIFEHEPLLQNKSLEVRYSKKSEFNDDIIKRFFKKKIDLQIKKFDNSLLHRPFFLN